QHQQQHINRMVSTDPDMIPPNLDDISQISHQSSPHSFMEHPGQRHPSTPVTSLRRRVSLLPTKQIVLDGNIVKVRPRQQGTSTTRATALPCHQQSEEQDQDVQEL
ncbi:hypothetical protein PFISCL1PPCAC_21974, partial [Pristionchus fissidentatus]